jgi:predicted nucleic acid-binding protein
MRVVIDTVILVRGLIGPYSPWGRLLFEEDDAFDWLVSLQIVEEYLDVIYRPELARKYRAVGTRNVDVILRKIKEEASKSR